VTLISGDYSVKLDCQKNNKLQTFLKAINFTANKLNVTERYGLPSEVQVDPNKIWLIKDPYLRHIRLKILWKDVMSLERCHRFKMVENPNCKTCGAIETVIHQLWGCSNANKIWKYASMFIGKRLEEWVKDIGDLIPYNNNAAIELIKSQCFRYLIQLDRSASITYNTFESKIRHILLIEEITLKKESKFVAVKTIENLMRQP